MGRRFFVIKAASRGRKLLAVLNAVRASLPPKELQDFNFSLSVRNRHTVIAITAKSSREPLLSSHEYLSIWVLIARCVMQSEIRMHRLVLAILTIILVAFLGFLFYLTPRLASERLEAITSLITVILVASGFVMMGAVEEVVAFQFGIKHKREFLSYLLLGFVSIVSGLYLAISETASLQTIALVVAPHALLFGVAELRMAQHLQHHPGQRRGLFISGLCETGLGVALVYGWAMSNERVAMLLGYAAIISILQLLPLLLYRRPAIHLKT